MREASIDRWLSVSVIINITLLMIISFIIGTTL
jgi:hypothetical protein